MGTSKLVIVSIFLAIIFSSVSADASIGDEEAVEKVVAGSVDSDSAGLKKELDQLKSKIHSLQSHIDEKAQELRSKDEIIAQKQKTIQEKSSGIKSLESEISSLQKKGKTDAQEQVVKAQSRIRELENQVNTLQKEVEKQDEDKKAVKARASEVDKKMHELSVKVENMKKINEEQKAKIQKTERALRVAEEEMLKAKLEALSRSKELLQVHGAWLPSWLAARLVQYQSLLKTHWNEHGKPKLDAVMNKALEKKVQARKWAEPHLEAVKSKWIPAMMEQWVVITTNAQPYVLLLKTKSIEVYEASKRVVTPHVIKAHEVVDHYFQEAKKFSKPYVDQIATEAKPYVDSARKASKPCIKEVVRIYRRLLESATSYHYHVQVTVREALEKHDLTKPLATKEFEWFAASALLALPIVVVFRLCSGIFCKKTKKPSRKSHTSHRRKAKRVHPDK